MLVTITTFALAKPTSLIQTTFNITRSSRINDHDIRTNITTSHITQVEVNTLTTDQSRVKERHTLQIRASCLPSAGLSKLMNTRASTRLSWHKLQRTLSNLHRAPGATAMGCQLASMSWLLGNSIDVHGNSITSLGTMSHTTPDTIE